MTREGSGVTAPARGRDAAELDPQFASIRPRKLRRLEDLNVGDVVVRVPGHVYGHGEVTGVRPGPSNGSRMVSIRYPRERHIFEFEVQFGRYLELHDPDGPKN